ncbi:hypothetical protein QQZ08_001291 [Neonectria magnoliae]|uniref:(S)-ureidoglycine aminohydrolase cupin domain-containing protein n=1 Tax=Neonectria magnoliae TaxID=2732573 RepID=A0ABR1IGS6_9HYPO
MVPRQLIYSSPLGDELACLIDGSATLTVVSTGEKYHIGPGTVVSSPKGLEVQWDIDAPFFKKYCENPAEWVDYHFTEPKEGDLVAGELYIRSGGSTGTMLSGIWRSGKGISGSDVDEQETLKTPYKGVLGDETILLLEGEVDLVETEAGTKHSFKAGDSIGLTSGMHVTWTSKGPFSKKLWVITRDEVLEAE